MEIEQLTFQLGNVVMLFEGLAKARVSRDDLFNLFEKIVPDRFDAGPVLIIRYIEQRIDILFFFEENRVEVKIATPSEEEWKTFSDIAAKVYMAIEGASLKAYGYNYFVDVLLKNADSAEAFLIEKFKSSLVPVEQQLESKISTLAMTLKYLKGGVQRQLTLTPKPGEKVLAVQQNVHYDQDQLNPGEFTADYLAQKADFTSLLERLFG